MATTDQTAFQTTLGDLADRMNKEPISGQGFISDLAGGAFEAVRSGTSDPFNVLQKITDVTHQLAKEFGIEAERPEIFKKIAEGIRPEDFSDEANLTRKIGRTIGGVLMAIPKYGSAIAATGVTGPLGMAAVGGGLDALTAWGQGAPAGDIVKEGAKGAALFGGLGVAGQTLSRWPRAGAMAGYATALEAATGTTNPEDLAITGITMGALGLHGRLPQGMKEKLHGLKYPDVIIDRMSIKDLRRVLRDKEEFVPKETLPPQESTTTTTAPPAMGWGDIREMGFEKEGLLGQEKAAGIEAVKTSTDTVDRLLRQRKIPDEEIARMPMEVRRALASSPETMTIPRGVDPEIVLPYIYERILLSKGFDLRSISALPYLEKTALALSSYTPKDIVIDPITGQLRYKSGTKPKIATQTEANIKVDNIVIDKVKLQETVDVLTKGAAEGKLGEVVVQEPPKTKTGIPIVPGLAIAHLGENVTVEKVGSKNVRIRRANGTVSLVPIDKLGIPEVRGRTPLNYNKDVYQLIKSKFDLEESDAKNVAAYLTEKNVIKPEEVTKFFDELPGLSEANAFKDHIIAGVKIKGERLFDLIIKPGEKEVAADQQLNREITKKLSEKVYTKARSKLMSEIKMEETSLINLAVMADNVKQSKNIKKEIRTKRLAELKKKATDRNSKLRELRSQLDALDKEWTRTQELRTKTQPVDTSKAKLKGVEKLIAAVEEGKNKAEELAKTEVTTEQAPPVTEVKPGDKAVATHLNITPEEAAKLRSELPPDPAGQFLAAAKAVGIDPAIVPEANRPAVIKAYLELLDAKAEEAVKVLNQVDKGSVETTQRTNKVISTDAKTDVELGKLMKAYDNAKAAVTEARNLARQGIIDIAELAEAERKATAALEAVAKRRNEINKKKDKNQKIGLEQIGYTVSKEESGAIVIRKEISPTIEHFYMVSTSEGKAPVIGETALKDVGKMVVDKSSGKPTVVEFPDINLPNADFFKKQFEQQVKDYYAKNGHGLQFRSPDGGIVLRTGIDPTLVVDAVKRLKAYTASFYTTMRERKGKNATIPREDIPQVQRDVERAQRARLSKAELEQLKVMNEQARTMAEGEATSKRAQQPTPEKDVYAQVALVDQFGQNAANRNPDVVRLNELGEIRNLRIGHANDRMIYGEGADIKRIFERINAQPNGEELRNIVGASLISDTKAVQHRAIFSLAKWYNISEKEAATKYNQLVKHPLVGEAREAIKKFLDGMADTNDLRKRGFFVNEYFPLIADMNNTYLKLKGFFANIKEPGELPPRYWTEHQPNMSQVQLNDLHAIFQKYKTWDDLPNTVKNKLRNDILQFESLFDHYAFIPPDVQEAMGVRKGTFNKHLQERKYGELLEYELDAERVLKFYTYTMNRAEADAMFIQEARPIVQKYASTSGGGSISDVRYYMEAQIKSILSRRTPSERYAAAMAEQLNNRIGREVLSPTWLTQTAGRVTTQVARGALGPDTAIRNIFDTTRTMVEEGGWTTLRALNTYISDVTAQITKGTLGKRIDPEVVKFYKLLLGDVLQDVELPRELKLGPRLARAEGKAGKALAFYDWLSDTAMTPLRATEHFNRFVNFLAAIENAGKRGESFESGVRVGLLHNTRLLPDLIIPTAYWNAAQSVVRTQYGYTKNLRNPLLRGPLARMSTIFWGYGLNTAQFAMNGLHRAIGAGDMGMLMRYGLYSGMQLSLASAVLALGLDFSSIFGVGILPIKILSLPWDMMKGAYNMAFGKRAEDRSSGSDDFLNAGAILSIPQWRYGKKVTQEVTNIMDGYKRAGALDLMARETTPFSVFMSLIGFPLSSNKEIYDLVSTMSDEYYEYRKDRRDLVKQGLAAMDKGDMVALNKIYAKAAKNNIALTHVDMRKYYNMHQNVTYLQQQLKRLPKHLRPAYEKQIQELEAQYLPSTMGTITSGRSMWSSPNRQMETEE